VLLFYGYHFKNVDTVVSCKVSVYKLVEKRHVKRPRELFYCLLSRTFNKVLYLQITNVDN